MLLGFTGFATFTPDYKGETMQTQQPRHCGLEARICLVLLKAATGFIRLQNWFKSTIQKSILIITPKIKTKDDDLC